MRHNFNHHLFREASSFALSSAVQVMVFYCTDYIMKTTDLEISINPNGDIIILQNKDRDDESFVEVTTDMVDLICAELLLLREEIKGNL